MKKEILNKVLGTLELFEPISLAEMDDFSLMSRTDTKFTFELNKLAKILECIQPFYKCLEIKRKRFSNYKTDYFDTISYQMYTAHQNGKLNRYKVRYRQYIDSKLSFLEVKFKNNKGKTQKTRINSWVNFNQIKETDITFLNRFTPFAKKPLKHVLTNEFSRVTLVSKTDKERLTIDFSLSFIKNETIKDMGNLIIAEVKQEKVNRDSKIIKALKKEGIRQTNFSKYTSGAALLNPQLKYNKFKSNMLYLNSINKDYGNIWNR